MYLNWDKTISRCLFSSTPTGQQSTIDTNTSLADRLNNPAIHRSGTNKSISRLFSDCHRTLKNYPSPFRRPFSLALCRVDNPDPWRAIDAFGVHVFQTMKIIFAAVESERKRECRCSWCFTVRKVVVQVRALFPSSKEGGRRPATLQFKVSVARLARTVALPSSVCLNALLSETSHSS